MKRDTFTVVLIVSTLFIDKLWKLFPDSNIVYQMFPYSIVEITIQTYYWMICLNIITLIYIHTWYYKFEEFRLIFGVWFLFQTLQFFEFFFTYNEALAWLEIGKHKIALNIMNFKYFTVASLTLHKLIWKN